MKKKVIVTGASGFIGHHLVPLLLRENLDVIALGRDIEKLKSFEWSNDVECIQFDFHKDSLNGELASGCSLIHLGWQGLPNFKSQTHIDENLPHSFRFVHDLIKKGVSEVSILGTCLEYGLQNGPLSSGMETKPIVPYAIAKDMLRKQLQQLQKENSFSLKWMRIFYLYGEGQNANSILPQLDKAIANGEDFFPMSGGEQIRDYLPVTEVASQILHNHLGKREGIFNVCSGIPISIKQLVEERIKQKESNIKLNLGYYPYTDYEPMAFWGQKENL